MNPSQSILPVPLKVPVEYITTADVLAKCIQQLSQVKTIALDLEFDQENYTYGSSLCLMQITSATNCFLIDPKAELDISLIFPLLENSMIQKVVHSSSEDLRLLHLLKCYPKNLADTELYAKLLNYERTSLGAMLQHFYGIELDKKMQKVNWELRPLKPTQLEYAANDVMYLLQLKIELEKQVVANNLLSFLNEENDLLSTTIHNQGPKDNFLKERDLVYLSPYHQYILNGLFGYRDNIAQQQNRPVHYIMNEETVKNLATDKINQTDWQNIKGIHPVLKSKDAQDKLFSYIEKLHTNAKHKKLSLKKSKREMSEVDFRSERAERELLKASVFTPIQNDIASNLGEHAMRFIFSTRTVNAIVEGELKISELKTDYRITMVKNVAQKLGINLSSYE